jgi:small GTP-binding protein
LKTVIQDKVAAPTIQKKVCLLGAFGVGKTSLVRRFIESIFDDHYHTTIGVKIDKKVVQIGDRKMDMVLWDIAGKSASQGIRASYLSGSSGFLLVADGTRLATLDEALEIAETARGLCGYIPAVLLLNKCDLVEQWEIEPDREKSLIEEGWAVMRTSAKTGEAVEQAFHTLGQNILEQ